MQKKKENHKVSLNQTLDDEWDDLMKFIRETFQMLPADNGNKESEKTDMEEEYKDE